MRKYIFTIAFVLATVTLSFSQIQVFKSDNSGASDDEKLTIPSSEYNNIKNILGVNSQNQNRQTNVFNVNSIEMDQFEQDRLLSNVAFLKGVKREIPLSISMNNISELISENSSDREIAYKILKFKNYNKVLKISNIDNLHIESIITDNLGMTHVKMNQYLRGLMIYGGQLYVHFTRGNGIENPTAFINGNWVKSEDINGQKEKEGSTPIIIDEFKISRDDAIANVKDILRDDKIKVRNLSEFAKYLIKEEQWQTQKVYYPKKTGDDIEFIPAFVVNVIADAIHRYRVIINALNGEEILKHDLHCSFIDEKLASPPPAGSVVAHAKDLNGVNREFHAYQNGNDYYLLDISRSMFDAAGSQLPDNPKGAIWTIDAQNTHPNNSNFSDKLSHVYSNNNTWTSQTSVSAHFNAGYAYDYYKNVFSRNSIDGKGGSIVSIINVSDEDGSSMGNAFWGGSAMYYGNGDANFSSPLARALDVSGHELTHGVIQNTADLEYYDESGAINESFADVFGAMMDRDDWKMGEEVVNTNTFHSGALRDLSNPHNGGNSLGDPGYQPAHTSEQYKGDQDNKGVHINSGIPNFAFYKFAKKVGKDKAEKVYYRALTYYLTKSSQFVDLRVAIEKSAKDLYGEQEKQFASQAFEAVGIGGSSSGGSGTNNSQKDLAKNPGNDYVLVTGEQGEALYLFDGAGQILGNPLLSTPYGIKSRPSISDDGSIIVFVGNDKKIHMVSDWNSGNIKDVIIQDQPIWRNVVIAKDGSLIGALTDEVDSKINVYSVQLKKWKEFQLVNPTSAQGVELGNVNFADAMEFDYSGEWIMYDCENSVGDNIKYWDIGFINVWNNATSNFADGRTNKLFSGLSNDISIGNPTFSKISPYIIAFDYLEGDKYYCVGANVETGKASVIYENTDLNYPTFSNDDKHVLFEYTNDSSQKFIGQVDVDNTKINPVANSAKYFSNYYELKWPIWFSDGTRKLTASSDDLPVCTGVSKTSLYPNPVSKGILSIRTDDFDSRAMVTIYTILGNKMISKEVDFKNKFEDVNISALDKGNYILRINDGKKSYVGKFVVVK